MLHYTKICTRNHILNVCCTRMCVNLTCDVAPATQSISDPNSRIRPPQIEFNFMLIITITSVSLTLSFWLSEVLHQTVVTLAGLLPFQQSLPLSFLYHNIMRVRGRHLPLKIRTHNFTLHINLSLFHSHVDQRKTLNRH